MLEQKIVELMTQAQQAVGKIAPEALELAIRQQFWSGVGQIAGGTICLILFIVFAIWTYRAATREGVDWEIEPDFITIGPLIPSLFTGIGALVQLCDTWAWVSIFDPKTAMFHEIFEKIMR